MVFYSWERDGLAKKELLWEALRLSKEEHRAVSLTGGGGKTSAMFRLADEMAEAGKTVIVTTTTHIFYPENRNVLETGSAEDVKKWLDENEGCIRGQEGGGKKGRILAAGQRASGGKLKSMPLDEIPALKELADILLIEADGSKQLPIKVPKEGEPVIPDCTDAVIGCMGIDCIGGEMEKVCFRLEEAAGLLGINSDREGRYSHRISCADAARILTSVYGTRKLVGGKDYRIMINKADGERLLKEAVEIVREIEKMGLFPCAVTSFL